MDAFAALLDGKWRRLASVMTGFGAASFVVVPLHELLHAAGCVLTGGAVERLEIQPLWGGALLARVFPWVTAGGAYAGRLAGFTPNGDLSYLATVLLPHLVLAPLGALVCRAAARRANPFLFGAGLLAAGQPVVSLFGDFYEAASIPLTALARAAGARWATALRGDDLTLVAAQAASRGATAWLLLVAIALTGAFLAALLVRLSGGIAPKEPEPG